jgi:hypothetical protein
VRQLCSRAVTDDNPWASVNEYLRIAAKGKSALPTPPNNGKINTKNAIS